MKYCVNFILKDDKVLLLKRTITNPFYPGIWTPVIGKIKINEKPITAILRETKEETRADVEMGMIYSIFNIPQINQIYVIHLAKLKDLSFGSTSESLDVKLFSKNEIPYQELAFPFVSKTIDYFFDDFESKEFRLRVEDIIRK